MPENQQASLTANFQHDCTKCTLVAVINVPDYHYDIYAMCGGSGYLVRYGNEPPTYQSSFRWTFRDALDVVIRS